MKKISFILIIFTALSFAKFYTPNIIGKWKGQDKREIGFLSFDEKGYAEMEMAGQKMGGENFMVKGRKCSLKYKLTTSVKPNQLDIIMTDLNTKETRKMLCIINFVDDTSLDIASNFSDKRPQAFTKSNSIRLIKEN